eukprot:CAMPEP_0206058496 /NCGR_PEP_ID=MMETSP1466-20131121/46805_1 /ASSEMBLY_ACC=CAM_ASM_001126 /TAXON_ID=44452 /ORGANISM="Pavlova gyrans, Strain CCMP608" /LENGTH=54 /DNA_ID=CAMNT_0053433791 /DNA_START=108 /DNA_END=269 /DNA_ORIENTATION=-
MTPRRRAPPELAVTNAPHDAKQDFRACLRAGDGAHVLAQGARNAEPQHGEHELN